ncbi:MAG: thioredoxin [Candidatus Doudnabacteria bacterium RIFCSPHIGHO2_02_FULL_46_11]|uniref:Thioredoxin n=1 Tax=Candidatus Doudnabacteria bacterium RIFCSPHIGHO2_02_FULL_46_11 TaxID=1817832 RepID=A0A1F5P410_9BACT|nr:MAG: thioredoxin [Candidatus Doudnabacteria bacterium RIFCSPHIGHO2_02_FULL_46_11]
MATVHITDQSFDQEVIKAPGLVLVDFWAPWCGPCKIMGPVLEELSEQYAGKAKITKLNLDENSLIGQQFNVMSIPTLKFFKDGNMVDEVIGAMPKNMVSQKIEAQLAG